MKSNWSPVPPKKAGLYWVRYVRIATGQPDENFRVGKHIDPEELRKQMVKRERSMKWRRIKPTYYEEWCPME